MMSVYFNSTKGLNGHSDNWDNAQSTEDLVRSLQPLTALQTSQFLQISTKSVYKLRKSGELEAVKVKGGYRFFMCDIMDYLLKNKSKSYVERISNLYFGKK